MSPALRLFRGFGVELEYMIVQRHDLNVAPFADEILKWIGGDYVSEVEVGELAWCNEIVLHVIELKTNGPATSLDGLASIFLRDVRRINEFLSQRGLCLMPTAMHPWMDPLRETRLWPHEYSAVYESYDRIFGCQGHGWSNLQSLHMNLPFGNEEEFGRLHAAIRLILPALPGLAASSPVMDGRLNGWVDNRLAVYRLNQRRVPSVTGRVVPEAVFSPDDYRARILEPIYRDIRPLDREGILQFEWLNSRGAIARFERGTIEIRLLDLQENPWADLALYELVVAVVRGLVQQRWADFDRQKGWEVDPLVEILEGAMRHGSQARVSNSAYLSCFGIESNEVTMGSFWQHLFEQVQPELSPAGRRFAEFLVGRSTLAERIQAALGPDPSRVELFAVYRRLVECLEDGEPFAGV